MGYVILIWILCGITGAVILNRYDRVGTGCLLGGLLGPLGLLMAWTMRDSKKLDEVRSLKNPPSAGGRDPQGRATRQCPYCAEAILAQATLCRYCRSEVEPTRQPDDKGRLQAVGKENIWSGERSVQYDCGHTVTLSPGKGKPTQTCPECMRQGRL